MRKWTTAAAGVIALFLAACRGNPDPTWLESDAALTGSVTYRSRIALPPDARVVVTLEDVSRADEPSTLVATRTIPTRGQQVPIPFELPYDPALIDPARRYAVRAQILRGNEPLFSSTAFVPVLTQGAPANAELVLGPPTTNAGAGTAPQAADLLGTTWKVVSLDGAEFVVGENLEQAHLILNSENRSLTGSTGVNGLSGSYELPDGAGGAALRLRPGAMTLIAGPEPLMRQEAQLLERLRQVDGFRLEGEKLALTVQGRPVVELRAAVPR